MPCPYNQLRLVQTSLITMQWVQEWRDTEKFSFLLEPLNFIKPWVGIGALLGSLYPQPISGCLQMETDNLKNSITCFSFGSSHE